MRLIYFSVYSFIQGQVTSDMYHESTKKASRSRISRSSRIFVCRSPDFALTTSNSPPFPHLPLPQAHLPIPRWRRKSPWPPSLTRGSHSRWSPQCARHYRGGTPLPLTSKGRTWPIKNQVFPLQKAWFLYVKTVVSLS